MLKGKKTYILTALGVGTVMAQIFGLIDFQTMSALLGLFGFGSVAALRAGVEKARTDSQ